MYNMHAYSCSLQSVEAVILKIWIHRENMGKVLRQVEIESLKVKLSSCILSQCRAGYWRLTPFLLYIGVVLHRTRSWSDLLHPLQQGHTHYILGSRNLQSPYTDTDWFDLRERCGGGLQIITFRAILWTGFNLQYSYHCRFPKCDIWCSLLCALAKCRCCLLLSCGSSPYTSVHAFCTHSEELIFYSQ